MPAVIKGKLVACVVLQYEAMRAHRSSNPRFAHAELVRRTRAASFLQSIREGRRRMQDEAFLAERMAMFGALAGGVANQINDPLAALIGNVDLVITELASLTMSDALPAEQVREVTEPLLDIKRAAERIHTLTRDLTRIARSEHEGAIALDINRVLACAIRIVASELHDRARVVTTFSPVPPIFGNEGRITHLLLNLLLYTTESIPLGVGEKHDIHVRTTTDLDGFALLEIQCIGPRTDRARTRSPAGDICLAVCHQIVSSLGGGIGLDSAPGAGTRVRVRFPAASLSVSGMHEVGTAKVARARHRILIVDDEKVMLHAMRRILAQDHDVEIAHDGKEALMRILAGESFDCILCDLMMPEMTGMQLHAKLACTNPEVAKRMVFMSGGAFSEEARRFVEETSNPCIDKPIDMAALRALFPWDD